LHRRANLGGDVAAANGPRICSRISKFQRLHKPVRITINPGRLNRAGHQHYHAAGRDHIILRHRTPRDIRDSGDRAAHHSIHTGRQNANHHHRAKKGRENTPALFGLFMAMMI
jgi:hypothetical protein